MHTDTDGLYSAMLFQQKENIKLDGVYSVEYGQDHTSLKYQFDNFYIFDFAENPGEDRTVLFLDHHLHQHPTGAQTEIIEEAPSCVRLVYDHDMCLPNSISEEDVRCIDIVDSGDYTWSNDFTKEDLLLPEPKNQLSKFVILNQLLRKNRKWALAEKLFENGSLSVDVNLYKIENDNGIKTVKYGTYLSNKQRLVEKIIADKEKYIKSFSEIPVLFTKAFSQEDWKGYDLNILGYIEQSKPFMVIVFDMANDINFQIVRNVFYDGPKKRTIIESLGPVIKDPRGHENILNFSYKNREEAFSRMVFLMSELSKEL